MLKRIKKQGKKTSPIYMGNIIVVPRSSLKKALELGWPGQDVDQKIEKWITESIPLPRYSENDILSDSALSLDILISSHRLGTSVFMSSEPTLPVLWRPSVKLHARLTRINDGNIVSSFNTKETMAWKHYIGSVFTFRNTFWGRVASDNDMKYLLGECLIRVLEWIKEEA